MTHQITPVSHPGYVDKRRLFRDDFESRIVSGPAFATANGAGSTTTLVTALADPTTGVQGTNVVRIGDEFKLFTTAGALKQETVFRVTAVAVAGSQTVTFTPAALVATASGDNARLVDIGNQTSSGEMDRRLIQLGFSALYVSKLTENDKAMQIRISDDAGSI